MIRKILSIVLSVLILSLPASLFADETTSDDSLRILEVKSPRENTVNIVFSDEIEIESVRVTIMNQDTKDNVRVESYNPVESDTRAVEVKIRDVLKPSTAYILTVNTAISQKNQTISAWVDAIRDFTTPAHFEGTDMSDGGWDTPETPPPVTDNPPRDIVPPANVDFPSAQNIPSDTHATEEQNTDSQNTHTGATPQAEALPETGASTVLLAFALAAVILIVLISFRRKA